MQTRILKPKHRPLLLVRPLRHGDVRTLMSDGPELSIRAAIA